MTIHAQPPLPSLKIDPKIKANEQTGNQEREWSESNYPILTTELYQTPFKIKQVQASRPFFEKMGPLD